MELRRCCSLILCFKLLSRPALPRHEPVCHLGGGHDCVRPAVPHTLYAIEKYLRQADIIASSTDMTGPPVSPAKAEAIIKATREAAKARLALELKAELRGAALTIVGRLIWAYGMYVPLIHRS